MLRDQLVTDVDDLVSPNPDVALIDEADSVLVDEALVPLVLAGTSHRETPKLEIIRLVGELVAGEDYDTDSDSRNVHLTEVGAQKVEAKLGGIDLYSEEHVGTTLTEVNVALHAHALLHRDVHYIVRDDAVHLINASRGRIAQLQRWPDGLQAAVEAKEGIETTETGEVLDTITVQALISRYPTVCGMTGTALAAGEQLRQFYKLGVSPIPPNAPNIREDEDDRVYITAAAKNDGIVEHIAEVHKTRQPVLVGTRDVAESEELHERLVKAGVPAVVLNAKNDDEEAQVIAEAGKLGSVTVSTQMAGRGTDIRLGGSDEADHDEVAELGGLHVVGTGRHHTERLDNQLRGRAGRQGDPGSSVFFSSWEDDVVLSHLEPEKLQQAADRDRRGRPHHQQEGGGPARPRAAHRRGQAAGGARQHLAVQRTDRTAARDPRRAPEHVAAHADCPRRTGEAVAGPLRRAVGEARARSNWSGSAGRSCSTTSTAAGPTTSPTCPTSGRASTCEPLATRSRSTSSTGWPSTRSPRWPPTPSRPRSRPSRPPTCSRRSRASTCRSWPGRRRRGRTWFTTIRWQKTRCRR